MNRPDRRTVLKTFAAGAAALCLPRTPALAAAAAEACTLSIGTYSLKGLTVEQGIALLRVIGYDAIEIATQTGMDAEPAKLPPARRADLRKRLADSGLVLTSLMQQISPAADEAQHRQHLQLLQQVVEIAHDLSPQRLPLVQTVLGGGDWEQKKTLFRDRLGDWGKPFAAAGMVLAIKPHRGGSLSKPEEAVWLIEQLGKPAWLRMVYDYSHYAFREMSVDSTVATALPYTAHVVVKDAIQKPDGKIAFALPGESGAFDYPKLLRLFYAGGYRGDVSCEVSIGIWKQPDYDTEKAARTCYKNMSEAFAAANIPRPRHVGS